MPGIVGLITKKERGQAEHELQLMIQALRHEPFYEVGTWIDELSGVYVGWIIRNDANSGELPIENERHDKILVFSGEEYSGPTTGERSYLGGLADTDAAFPAGLNG